ncbi:hypothetical protein DPM19_10120 [Actinomadura craniellae]|uniref:DUF3188 domain-containing protein n=1 Tax=Actinomadura craniellae TaxID=2231787 RepID=A0A365H7I5_9ACTN|nr:hypothetical protein [Actinomadura craniellae]RAY15080.1 hypothetical protein DPM19_10120 [Actinomadura craniellae]
MRRHRFDPGALAAGVYFLAMGGIFLATGLTEENVVEPGILAPTAVIGIGVVGLVRVLSRSRRRDS